ncbi:TPA: ATP-dependent helicase [Methanosarcina acetivorans]|uniref:DNA 3'-5' helicase n=2 Tax=Methanosarcina acetivorans TaxID=2214 RepID=Q8TNY7_METAC|nr:ATP-dependent helicase [Methanosarcina acetivorans]AAM05538.1 DNA helicase [Methanosarcina acetivorans C2A]HIH93685.1 ATP-dependent helicase [Methanosarcina acetivorans]
MNHSKSILISSGDVLDNFDHHFRVIAGPGAGKTYWLTNHVKNVVKHSSRLNPVSKVACITYTNIAAEQVLNNLGECVDKVEVSTIHSFFYKNIIKPYASHLYDELGNQLIAVEKIDGHEEHNPSFKKIESWIGEYNPDLKFLIYQENGKKISSALSHLTWEVESSGKCFLDVPKEYRLPKKLKKSYFDYKKLYWQEGRIHHEDVLYFSYRILCENPILLIFLSAKFPYIFLDEFQDTNPIQTMIVKMLAKSGSTIGVIGDPAQSIYSFQGAKREDFLDFYIQDIAYYEIQDNRRSTSKIIRLLNHMRKKGPVQQDCIRNEEGECVRVIIYQKIDDVFDNLTPESDFCVLTLKNSFVTKLKSTSQDNCLEIWDKFKNLDYNRQIFYYHLSVAIAYARQHRYENALNEFLHVFRPNHDGELREPLKGQIPSPLLSRSIAISVLEHVLDLEPFNLSLYRVNESLFSFLSDNGNKYGIFLKKIAKGNFKKFSESVLFSNLVSGVKLGEDLGYIRTIHKAKGAEFKTVFVYLHDESHLNCVLNPDLENEDDLHRIFYVAFSRAMDNLFILTPSLSPENWESLKGLNLEIEIYESIEAEHEYIPKINNRVNRSLLDFF